MGPTTPNTRRYPNTLSQKPGPSRPSRQKQTTYNQQKDNARADRGAYPSQPQYASLADLLQQAGYKDVRVMTPEGEKIRRIKKTLDDDHEDLQDLYGAMGLSTVDNAVSKHEHQRQTITEPIQPMKSSSDLLRSLALQDRPDALNEPERSLHGDSDHSASSSTWWVGSMTSSFSRAARAVMDMSPPSKGATTFEEVARQFTGVGLGLAKGGEGVRKVKSNWELDRTRRGGSHSPPQEERPPMPRFLSERPKRPMSSDTTAITDLLQKAPPPAFESDAFGYSPLPDDYETQCEDDDAMFNTLDMYQDGSLGSTQSRSSSERGIDELILSVGAGESTSTTASIGGIGKKILMNTVEYDDELESPTMSRFILPVVDVDIMPTRPESRRSSTSPEPLSAPPLPERSPPKPKPQLKYGDRATKLRMAQSTPALRRPTIKPKPSWLGLIQQALGRPEAEPTPVPSIPALPAGPMRISAAKVAAPTVSAISPVVCDSAAADAQDLPAVPPAMGGFTWEQEAPLTLRLKKSLASIKTAVGLVEEQKGDGTSPVLTPQVSWTEQGEQFAHWTGDNDESFEFPENPAMRRLRLSQGSSSSKGSIDYSKSFFYKPPTPPHPGATTSSAQQGTPSKAQNPVARRQRSIKSLRQNLLIPQAPVPPMPAEYENRSKSISALAPPATPTRQPPILAISSPGACDAGLPPKQLVLEGEEWDAKDEGGQPGEWGRRKKTKKRTLKKKKSAMTSDSDL